MSLNFVELDVEDITTFRPRQKAATVLVAMGPGAASNVLAHLTEEEVEMLALEISRMGPIPGNVQSEILEEFYEDALANRYVTEGGVEYAKELLANWKGAKGEEIITRLMAAVQVSPFHFLSQIEPEQLLQFLQDEHPQTVALIIGHLPHSYAAKVLVGLDEAKQAEVAMRVATMDRTSPEVIKKVEDSLKLRLGNIATAELTAQKNGVKELAEMLNNADRSTERAILEHLADTDPEIAEAVRALMFVFEDITTLDDRDIQEVLRAVDTKTLALAMKGTPQAVRDKILTNLSERAALTLVEEMEVMGAVKMTDVEAAQSQIIFEIRRLDEEGKIILRRGADGGMVE
jgi:flagellar motor switch protein FliG